MLFNSLTYLIFLPFVYILFLVLPHKWRWIWLLLASYFFYMSWKIGYVFLLLLSTVVDYIAGISIDRAKSKTSRKAFLILSLVTNLGILFTFKYFNFFSDSAAILIQGFGMTPSFLTLEVLLPVGISFYTFQSMSYTIDVYKRVRAPEKHFGFFALYVSFFPQLVAGPIERSTRLLPQLRQTFAFDYTRTRSGLSLMLWGFFKKVVIADNISVIVNHIYADPTSFSSSLLLLANYLFAIQIYCDFSGYSDIAIGTARLFGIDLMKNFNNPYGAKSFSDFWKRWHISLSSWFKDYLYIPLGGSRVSLKKWIANIMIVFVLSGFWHGANWTFILWGTLHGIFLLSERGFKSLRLKIPQIKPPLLLTKYGGGFLRWFVVFHCIIASWVLFRSASLEQAIYILTHLIPNMTDISTTLQLWLNDADVLTATSDFQLTVFIGLIFIMLITEYIQKNYQLYQRFCRWPIYLRWAIYYTLIFTVLLLGRFNANAFIYFQF